MYDTGNSIGETNVELIRQALEAKGHEDILGTLSDDEGEYEDEDEQENDSESDENDEPSEEVPVDGVASEDSVHEPIATFTAPQHSPVSDDCNVVVKMCVCRKSP